MTKRQGIMLLGAWVIVFLFLGFPPEWDNALSVISGFLIILLAYRMRGSDPRQSGAANVPFVEHKSLEPAPNAENESKDIISPNP